ncbi:MAG: class E sortase [Micrococcales bacterium]|nr:class E sortase [Micrococcales bacterium]
MSPHQAAARSRSRLGAVLALGVLVLSTGLGAAAQFGYSYWGTSVLADRQKARDITAFRGAVPQSPNRTVPLYTDLLADPPPPDPLSAGMLGLLYVPSWMGDRGVYGETMNGVMPIKEGTGIAVLNTGAAGHYSGTALAGQVGNFAMAAHRRTYGNSFFHLPDLTAGDVVGVETANAWYVYRVTSHEQVLPDAWQVVAPVPDHPGELPTQRDITMTTCNSVTQGPWGHDHRWVVHGVLIGWAPHSAGIPAELQPSGGA